MHRKVAVTLLLVFSFVFSSTLSNDALAEKEVLVRIDQDQRCVDYSAKGNPPRTEYKLEKVQVWKEGITTYSYDNDRGVICFKPQSVGTTRVTINVKVFEYEPWGRLKETRNLTRRYRVKVRHPSSL